jgi:hypothetical protein
MPIEARVATRRTRFKTPTTTSSGFCIAMYLRRRRIQNIATEPSCRHKLDTGQLSNDGLLTHALMTM